MTSRRFRFVLCFMHEHPVCTFVYLAIYLLPIYVHTSAREISKPKYLDDSNFVVISLPQVPS